MAGEPAGSRAISREYGTPAPSSAVSPAGILRGVSCRHPPLLGPPPHRSLASLRIGGTPAAPCDTHVGCRLGRAPRVPGRPRGPGGSRVGTRLIAKRSERSDGSNDLTGVQTLTSDAASTPGSSPRPDRPIHIDRYRFGLGATRRPNDGSRTRSRVLCAHAALAGWPPVRAGRHVGYLTGCLPVASLSPPVHSPGLPAWVRCRRATRS